MNKKKSIRQILTVTLTSSIAVSMLVLVAYTQPVTRIPMRVSIEGSFDASLGNKVTHDGRGAYSDGVDGVSAAADSSSGFTLITKTRKITSSSRYVYYDFSDRIYPGDNGNTAPWTGYPKKFQSRFHVLNFLKLTSDSSDFGGFSCPYGSVCGQDIFAPFHMYMLTYGDTGPLANGRDEYVLRFKSANYLHIIDHPCSTSYLRLYHYKEVRDANGSVTSPEKWIVTPDLTSCTYNGNTFNGAFGALTLGTNPGNYGQYLMPFKLTIQRK